MHLPTGKSRFALPGVPMVRLLSVLRSLLITEYTNATDSESAARGEVCKKRSSNSRVKLYCSSPGRIPHTRYAVGLVLLEI